LSNLPKKSVVLIVDGLGDLPVPALDGRTPLEAAETPVLDWLAAHGLFGLVDPVERGEVPNTHSGAGILLGVPPGQTRKIRRGPVEAAGAGRVLREGEIALRVNFATLEESDDGLRIIDRRAGRVTGDTGVLADSLRELDLGDGVTAMLRATDQHRGVLVMSGPGLDEAVTDTDPGDSGGSDRVQTCRPVRDGAERTAEKINELVAVAYRRLSRHPLNAERIGRGKLPANGIITRGAGAAFSIGNILRERGIGTAVVAGCNTVIGMARLLGFETLTDERFTADSHTDLDAKMEAVARALDRRDLVYLHVKAPDLYSHDRQPAAKRDFLEKLDRAMARLTKTGAIIALAADHTTDSNTGAHTANPVPVLLHDPALADVRSGEPLSFGETACRDGNMPRQRGHQFLIRILEQMGY
jgi:2,3-bisphosphoglycerate-independent phosphoglycerate mutase